MQKYDVIVVGAGKQGRPQGRVRLRRGAVQKAGPAQAALPHGDVRRLHGRGLYPAGADGRLGGIKFNRIHPCVSFPLGDIELSVFPAME